MSPNRMKIPVFVSAPSPDNLNADQTAILNHMMDLLDHYRLEPRSLGRSDYPLDAPIREVIQMVRHCSGGIVLGFEQFRSHEGVQKYQSIKEKTLSSQHGQDPCIRYPTPWNHLEAGILLAADLPVLIYRQSGIEGGVFDSGASDAFVHPMPELSNITPGSNGADDLDFAFQRWVARVRTVYYGVRR